MFYLIYSFLKLFILSVLFILAAYGIKKIVEKRKNLKEAGIFGTISVLSIAFFILAFNFDLYSSETSQREEGVDAFISNFGFTPPKIVKTIKLKNKVIYDAQVHWMSFSYDSKVLEKIIEHDKILKIAENKSIKYQSIIENLKETSNNPDWLILPDYNTDRIYYKKDFLKESFSEYYLWTDNQTKMTFLYIHSF
jgi:hypothetical protein